MNEQEHIFEYNKYVESENNRKNEQCPNIQSLITEDENSCPNEVPKVPKSYEPQIVGIINEDTKKGKTNGTRIKNTSLVGKETTLLGKKRSEPDTSNYEINMKEVSENALINIIQFLNEISYVYEGNLFFKISKDLIKDLIKREDFVEKNLDKNIKEILLMMEDIGLQENQNIKNKIKSLLELELEHKNENLSFCKDIFKKQLKELLVIHINDLNFKLYNFRLKTLKDNPIYSNEEKMEIRNQILNYLKSQKEQTLSINDNKEIINQPISDLNKLSNAGNKEEKLSSENIISNMKNEKNQTRDDKQIIKKSEESQESKEPNKDSQKLNNKTNSYEKGGNIGNLKRKSVKKCFKSLCKMIEKIANVKLMKVSTYNDISKNSAEQYLIFFNEKIGDIIARENDKFINSILISKDTSKEIIFLKDLFRMKFFDIMYKYINDLPFSFTNSRDVKIELKLFKEVKNKLFRKYSKNITEKINEILKANGRLRNKNE
jgi:hypothetical protein